MINPQIFADVAEGMGMVCWVICFVWMHRISTRQDALLREMQEVMKTVEFLSREEHQLIQEVHPKVADIKESVEQVADAVDAK